MALPFQILQFFLYFLIFLGAHRIIFYESQQLCNPVVESFAQFIVPFFREEIKYSGKFN